MTELIVYQKKNTKRSVSGCGVMVARAAQTNKRSTDNIRQPNCMLSCCVCLPSTLPLASS